MHECKNARSECALVHSCICAFLYSLRRRSRPSSSAAPAAALEGRLLSLDIGRFG
jgi:hypothetical protein